MSRPRLLLAITVFNGRLFVPRCLHSARRLKQTLADVDVLVLDDASPEAGFSEDLAALCQRLGFRHYRSPRNLGIVRNVNLGLLAAVEGGYDYVVISNSDVMYAESAVDLLVAAACTDATIGSVTAWSNNVSIYSAPNVAPDRFLSEQEVVDWLSVCLSRDYAACAIDIPAGISFSMLIPTAVIRHVGLMDPVFGRGYCEETDWSLRSLAAGYRVTLAPAAFVYHQGRGSSVAAGLLQGDLTTVPVNEQIIDYRYPLFRDQVDTFVHGGILGRLQRDAMTRIIRDAMRQFGFYVHIANIAEEGPGDRVRVSWSPQQPALAQAFYRGFQHVLPLGQGTLHEAIDAFEQDTGHGPKAVVRPAGVARQHAQRRGRPMYPAYV